MRGFLDLDRAGAAHLAEALRAHRVRVGSGAIPPDLLDLEGMCAAWGSQERPSSAGTDATAQAVPMEMYTVEQAAEALNLSERQTRRLVADGSLPSVTVGRARRVRRSDLDAFIAGLDQEQAS